MADLKRKTLQMSSGKQINLYGSSIGISRNLELGEGYAPNILSVIKEQTDGRTSGNLSNPYKLTVEELMDLADFNIQLWMDLKAALRKYGQVDPRIFGQEMTKTPSPESERPQGGRKRRTAEKESPE
jgi:hypothetical protein